MRKLLASVAALIALAGFASSVAAQTAVTGSAAAGEKKAAMCIGCHSIPGYQSSFPEVHKVPMIAGQGAKYIQSALNAYKAGDRKHPTMKGIAGSLTDQDIADLAAYYESLPTDKANLPETPAQQPPAEVAELLKKGNCVSCHGANFSKPIDGAYPKLAGQHSDYLYVALKAYQTQNNPQVGRANPVMGGMASGFTHAQLKLLANYIGSLDGDLRVVAQSRFKSNETHVK
jgi:cytochrome c553